MKSAEFFKQMDAELPGHAEAWAIYQDGVADERERIVGWLRGEADKAFDMGRKELAYPVSALTDLIEKGAHRA